MKLYPIMRLPQAFGLRNDECLVKCMVAIMRLPQKVNMKTENKKKSLIIDLYYFYFITK